MNRSSTVRRPAGYTIKVDVDGSGTEEHDTLQCVHCGCHWQVRPGSGKTRGFCRNCMGPVCGPRCQVCYPAEKQLDDAEKAYADKTKLII